MTIWILISLYAYLSYDDIRSKSPLIYTESSSSNAITRPVSTTKSSIIVASKKGKTYYYGWCTGVARIKAENKITFTSVEEAVATGRKLASGCK